MLESIYGTQLTVQSLIICSMLSIVLGMVVAFVHTRTARYSKNFAITLVVLPVLVQSVMMVNGNLGTGIAILGAFSLVRFRSIPGTSREIVSVFFAMAVGLATGTGYVIFAVCATVLIAIVLLALHRLHVFEPSARRQLLKITMPEDTDHMAAFVPVLEKRDVSAELETIKTKNMGSLYELTYGVKLPATLDPKVLMDDLRIANGNLAIAIFESSSEEGL
jgi:hypothetical protein